MHWFWRAVIAVWAAGGGTLLVSVLLWKPIDAAYWWLVGHWGASTGMPVLADAAASLILFELPVLIAGLVGYGVVTRLFGPTRREAETRCRKCDYILRGLTEPRCPECGERI